MANNLTTYLENKLLDESLGKTAYALPTTYLCLFTANPGEAGSFTNEVAAGVGYGRVQLSPDTDAAAAGATQNNALKEFGPCTTTPWGSVTYVGIADSATIGAGNLLWYGALAVAKTIGVGDKLDFNSGDLTFSMD